MQLFLDGPKAVFNLFLYLAPPSPEVLDPELSVAASLQNTTTYSAALPKNSLQPPQTPFQPFISNFCNQAFQPEGESMDYETDTCEKQSLGDSAQLFSLPLGTAHAKYPCAIFKLFSLVMGSSLVKKGH